MQPAKLDGPWICGYNNEADVCGAGAALPGGGQTQCF